MKTRISLKVSSSGTASSRLTAEFSGCGDCHLVLFIRLPRSLGWPNARDHQTLTSSDSVFFLFYSSTYWEKICYQRSTRRGWSQEWKNKDKEQDDFCPLFFLSHSYRHRFRNEYKNKLSLCGWLVFSDFTFSVQKSTSEDSPAFVLIYFILADSTYVDLSSRFLSYHQNPRNQRMFMALNFSCGSE